MFVLIGSGPGIGRSTAALFAEKKFDTIVLISRNAERLEEDKRDVVAQAQKAGRKVEVKTFAVDIVDSKALQKTLNEVERLGELEVLLFNAARVEPTELLKTPAEVIMKDFQLTNISLYQVAIWAIPLLQASAKKGAASTSPSFFVTGGMLYKSPVPQVFSLSMVKTAQRNLCQTLDMTYGKEIHVGKVSVGGVVSPDKPHMSPEFIAGKFWELYSQPKDKWTFEIEVPEKE